MISPPFLSNYYVNQLFEVHYACNALQACHDVAGAEFFLSSRYPGQFTSPEALLRDVANAVWKMWWTEACSLASASVVTGGTNYTTGQQVYLVHDRDRYGLSVPGPNGGQDAVLTITATAGVVTGLAVATPGVYAVQPFEGNAGASVGAPGTGCFVYSRVGTVQLVSGGTGYASGNRVRFATGRPIGARDQFHCIVRVTAVNAQGAITGFTVETAGKYEQMPATASAMVNTSGTTGSGATFTAVGSASGAGLRVNPTWGTPFKNHYAGASWKIAPIRDYPTGPSYSGRDDWTGAASGDPYPPRDICLRPEMRDNGAGTEPSLPSALQELDTPSNNNVLGHWILCGEPNAIQMACEFLGVAVGDLAAARAKLVSRGIGTSGSGGSGAKIENWWPIYSAIGPAP
jgi:hypothetical protein